MQKTSVNITRDGTFDGSQTNATSKAERQGLVGLAERIIALIESARQRVADVANVAQVYTNYEIGRQIVEEEQGGKQRADYGKQILIALSQKLSARFGRGWSVDNLERMRKFFLAYSRPEISASDLRKSGSTRKSATGLRKSGAHDSADSVRPIPKFTLGWSHYLLLMRIADPVERAFYEREATQGRWTFTRLERMYRASTFERLQISKDKEKVRNLMVRPAPDVEVAGEALKDPVVAEFLGTPDKYSEGELEDRIFDHIQDFMLEMGKGFTFHGLFSKKREDVKVTIFTSEHYDKKHVPHRKISPADVATFNAQYPKLAVRYTETFHDRFLVIDDKELYLIGASLKDLGRKCFAFTKLDAGAIRGIKKSAFAASVP